MVHRWSFEPPPPYRSLFAASATLPRSPLSFSPGPIVAVLLFCRCLSRRESLEFPVPGDFQRLLDCGALDALGTKLGAHLRDNDVTHKQSISKNIQHQ